jgi:hypothetical protein
MRRSDLSELHHITPIANLPSILGHGILCHRRASQVAHESVAMQEIQNRRAQRRVPSGRWLHEYVNLYFNARNPMLYLRRDRHASICVLRIAPSVLDLPGAVIADGHASSNHVRFGPAPAGLERINRELIFAERWTHEDPIEQLRHKTAMCSEVLIPDRVAPSLILGAYVSCLESFDLVRSFAPGLPVTLNPRLFFRG